MMRRLRELLNRENSTENESKKSGGIEMKKKANYTCFQIRKKIIKENIMLLVCSLACVGIVAEAGAAIVDMGEAESFGVLGSTTVTNTGQTTVDGDIGVWSGTAITGFYGTNENDGPGTFTGTSHQGDTVAQNAQGDASTAYTNLAGEPMDTNMSSVDLGGKTLAPGVYKFDSSAALTGDLTLDGAGDYVFQIGSTLTTGTGSSVQLINGADFNDVFWQVGSSGTLGGNTAFAGTIIAYSDNTLNGGVSLDGRVISLNGFVTLDNNIVTVPEPGTLTLMLAALGGLALSCRRRRRAA